MNNKTCIAISGKSGCGNTTVSLLVSEEMQFKFINYTFRNMAKEQGVSLESLLERAKTDPSLDRELDEKQKQLASEGSCVLGSRLAIWLVKDSAFTVYLRASEDTRAKRIHVREGGSLDAIKAFTQSRDTQDSERYKKLYNIDNNDYSFVDLVLDTDNVSPQELSSAIIQAYKKAVNNNIADVEKNI